jgi:outer membrane protein
MKKTIALLALAAALFFSPASQAADGVSFGVIDMTRVMKETDAAKGILAELEAKRKEYEGQIEKEGDNLSKLEKDIVAKKSKMNEEEFNKARADFEKKIADAQKMVQERKVTFDKAFGDAIGKLRAEAAKYTAEVAKERGYDAVVTQEAVVLAEPALDVTDDVIARLNKNVKKIAIKW